MQTCYQTYNPQRTVDWRYTRVLELVEHEPQPLRPAKRDDTFIRTARQFVLRYRNMPEENRDNLFGEYPGLYYAYRLYVDNDEILRTMLHARLLSGQSMNSIAYGFSTSTDSILWYEALFYNVRDRLANRDWIIRKVFGAGGGKAGVRYRSWNMVLNFFAYFGGPLALNHILTGFEDNNRLLRTEDTLGYFDAQIRKGVSRRVAAEVMGDFPVNEFNIVDLITAHTKFLELEQKSELGSQKDAVGQNIEAMLRSLPFCVGDEAKNRFEGSPILALDDYDAELRDDELQLIAANVQHGAAQEVLQLKMPLPRKTKDENTKPAN